MNLIKKTYFYFLISLHRYIFFILLASNLISAETWWCDMSSANNGRGNINEQKIYSKYNNYYLKKSQFGDKKLQTLEDNDEVVIISSKSTNVTLSVTLDKRDKTFIEKEIDKSGHEINKVEGICNVSQ
jgi:hypothetical protein